MGMNFSPMYQPVSTKTIKADGDLNVNPYDLLATDVKCDTVEADEFVGGVGNFSSLTDTYVNGSLSVKDGIKANLEGYILISSTLGTSGDVLYASRTASSISLESTYNGASNPLTLAVSNFSIVSPEYKQISTGVYYAKSLVSGTLPTTVTATAQNTSLYDALVYYRKSGTSSYSSFFLQTNASTSITLDINQNYQFYAVCTNSTQFNAKVTVTAPASSIYAKYKTLV